MRNQLRQLEGQLVLITARKVSQRRSEDGRHFVLIKAAKVWRWDGLSPIDVVEANPPAAQVDHLWLQTSGRSPAELLERLTYGARIGWYRRSDGSVDLGATVLPMLAIEQTLIEFLKGTVSWSTAGKARSLRQLLQDIEQHIATGAPVLAQVTHPHELLKAWRYTLDNLERSAAAEERAFSGTAMKELRRYRPGHAIELFPVPSTRRRRPQGIRPTAGAKR